MARDAGTRLKKSLNSPEVTILPGAYSPVIATMLEQLHRLVQQVAADDDIRALVLSGGASRFFSAGFDVGEVFRYDGGEMRSFFGKFIDVYEGIQELPKGVVAAVSGHDGSAVQRE